MNIVFDNGNLSFTRWKMLFKEELSLVCSKAKQKVMDTLTIMWIENTINVSTHFLGLRPSVVTLFTHINTKNRLGPSLDPKKGTWKHDLMRRSPPLGLARDLRDVS